MDKYKELYDSLLQDDEFHVIFKGMTGDWNLDKDKFVNIQQKMENELGLGGNDE